MQKYMNTKHAISTLYVYVYTHVNRISDTYTRWTRKVKEAARRTASVGITATLVNWAKQLSSCVEKRGGYCLSICFVRPGTLTISSRWTGLTMVERE
jgi:hypothetical protein